MFRTDSHNNPTAFTTDIAKQAGLKEGAEWTQGDGFGRQITINPPAFEFYTARLIGDPIALTIYVIDTIGFYAGAGFRWSYIAIPKEAWAALPPDIKAGIIGGMYNREGGTAMIDLFPRRLFF